MTTGELTRILGVSPPTIKKLDSLGTTHLREKVTHIILTY
jgi:hypothetical protein